MAVGLAALGLAATPAAGRDVLAPGLVAERLVRPGPVVVDLIRLDRYPRVAAARRTPSSA